MTKVLHSYMNIKYLRIYINMYIPVLSEILCYSTEFSDRKILISACTYV